MMHLSGVPLHLRTFEPTQGAAWERIAAIHPNTYARTRNALDGAVTGLSPYITHGFVNLADVAQAVAQNYALGYQDKLVFELGWRAFFHHVWARVAQPKHILQDMRSANVYKGRYSTQLPADIREGRTGVPAIDAAVRQLYATGYLHNHARMWLASYCVHLRKVHWRAGADWLYAHLLDGDLPSNHLSWQWVAATFSSKPYLFNASNVAKFAPQAAYKAWVSPKTAIDMGYEELDAIARLQGDVGAEPGVHPGVTEPAVFGADTSEPGFLGILQEIWPENHMDNARAAIKNIALNKTTAEPPGPSIELVHPWMLVERNTVASQVTRQGRLRIGIIHTPAHAVWPWSAARWRFVLTRMRDVCDQLWLGNAADLTACACWPAQKQVASQTTLFEGYHGILPRLATLRAEPGLFVQPDSLCLSFTKFYERAQRQQPDFSKLLQNT